MQSMDETQKEVLRNNHNLLVNSLDLSATRVLDKLQQEDVISADEQEDILSRRVKKDQNARLLFLLKRINASKQPFESFIKILESNYGFIATELGKSYAKFSSDRHTTVNDVRVKCLYCQLTDNLIPNYVSHHLYEDGIITDDDLEELNNDCIPRQDRVKKLLELLDGNPTKLVWESFCRSLQPKYAYILTWQSLREHCFRCVCVPVENDQRLWQMKLKDPTQPTCPNGGLRFINTEAPEEFDETLHLKLLACKERTDFRYISNGNKAHVNKTEAACAKHDIEHHKRQITRFGDKTTSFSTRDENADIDVSPVPSRIDHNVSNRTPKEVPISKQVARRSNPYHTIGVVSKTLPNERKLMTLCAKLWEKLFYFREEGNWEMFYLFSKRSMDHFASNPDVLVLLYRIEMSVATFYKYDKVKAYNFYEKAVDIIPKTTIPTWHLGRLLPLKLMLLSKDRNFAEASCLSEETQQTVTTLGPCLSTACVNFFEALYLENILRCTRKDSKSAKRLAERIKQCFLTAIDHFQKEPFFPMKSFLNQVYLFLALFSLGVDFQFSSYMNSLQANQTDIEIAEHYLNKFENGCWDKSTNWSRMLFFIARGEQHKRRNNLGRSLDYFRDAHSCAVDGAYSDQINFISLNIDALKERQKQCTKLQPQTQEDINDLLHQVIESAY